MKKPTDHIGPEHGNALLDRIDGDPDFEDGADAEPSLAAPENHHGSQVVWMRGNGQDREAEVAEVVLPEVVIVSPVPRIRPAVRTPEPYVQLRQSSMVAAAAVALIDLAGVH